MKLSSCLWFHNAVQDYITYQCDILENEWFRSTVQHLTHFCINIWFPSFKITIMSLNDSLNGNDPFEELVDDGSFIIISFDLPVFAKSKQVSTWILIHLCMRLTDGIFDRWSSCPNIDIYDANDFLAQFLNQQIFSSVLFQLMDDFRNSCVLFILKLFLFTFSLIKNIDSSIHHRSQYAYCRCSVFTRKSFFYFKSLVALKREKKNAKL